MLVKPSQLGSNLIKLGQTRSKLVLFGTGHYTVYQGNSSVAWDSRIHYLRQRFEVYFDILGKITRGLGHSTEFQYNVPPADGWTIRESDLDYGRYVKELSNRL